MLPNLTSVLCSYLHDWLTKKTATSRARNQAKAQAASKGSQLKANAGALRIQCTVRGGNNKMESGGFILILLFGDNIGCENFFFFLKMGSLGLYSLFPYDNIRC